MGGYMIKTLTVGMQSSPWVEFLEICSLDNLMYWDFTKNSTHGELCMPTVNVLII